MSQSRLLDIIIPSFNRPGKLFTLLKTGLALEMEGVYFVVIDDGSTIAEQIEDIGLLTVQQVCEYFKSPSVICIRNSQNIGLARSWVKYYESHCDAKYTVSVVDKDFFINKKPILNALQKLEADPSLCMVVIPLRQEDRANTDLLIDFKYPQMSGQDFISNFVQDSSLQHCTSYGIKRVSAIKKAQVPKNLNLRKYNLDDGFGIDIDLVLRLAAVGQVAFEEEPHVKRVLMEGATERYPLTFAYTYYQYAKHAIKSLKRAKSIAKQDAKLYIQNWLLLILRGLVVAYRPVHGSELEKGTSRIRKHLKIPIHVYLLKELVKYRITPTQEMKDLYILSMRLTLEAFQRKVKRQRPS